MTPDPSAQSNDLRSCIDRLQGGDEQARDELLRRACERLTRLTRNMLRDFPGVARWEQTDDVFQNAMLRLCRALKETTPQTVRGFLALAALQIRRELIDLARHYYGPHGQGANYESNEAASGQANTARGAEAVVASTMDPNRLAAYGDFHEQAGALPDEEREVFDLLWYQGLSHAEAAEVLGISDRSLQRRWHQTRVKLYRAMNGRLPGD